MNNHLGRLHQTVGILIALILCLGCHREHPPTPGGPSARLVIGSVKAENRAILIMAERLGYFQEQGLAVEIKLSGAGAEMIQDLKAGRLDLMTSSDFVIATNLAKLPDLRILAAIDQANSVYLVARKDKGIRDPSDLRGKRIGLVKGSIAEFYLGKYLFSFHIRLTDVSVVAHSAAELEEALRRGSIDAAISWDPFARRMKNELGDEGLSWAAQLNNPWHVVLVASVGTIEKQHVALGRLMKALVRAETYVANHPEETRRQVAEYTGMPTTYLEEVWGDNRFQVTLDRGLLLTLEDQSRWLQRTSSGPSRLPNYLNSLHLDALQQADPGAVTIIH